MDSDQRLRELEALEDEASRLNRRLGEDSLRPCMADILVLVRAIPPLMKEDARGADKP